MRLTQLVSCAGWASKLGPTQLAEVLRQLPQSTNPNLLVGFENKDDAGVLRLSDDSALVQTVDFFTPVVDDPYSFGAVAAANALSDIYAMGGTPVSALNIACFNPGMAPPEVWAAILQGGYDKATEAGAVILGGHSVEDNEPKFGMAVTGFINPNRIFANTNATPGDRIFLTKPIGSGILTTGGKNGATTSDELSEAIGWMSMLNAEAARLGHQHNVRCATDITGFGLAGHLFNIAKASNVTITIQANSIPLMCGVRRLYELGMTTGGAKRNRQFLGENLVTEGGWWEALVTDPQTSGGLALFTRENMDGATEIGQVSAGPPTIVIKS